MAQLTDIECGRGKGEVASALSDIGWQHFNRADAHTALIDNAEKMSPLAAVWRCK
ncbi:hypothetical protein [Pseudolysobacter antarcticus]|uniref:hypothetical protein n=1 Tax=Pseudolysobacter antarcticus TaxID=2511995 RepID=UPI0013EDDF53|nr:hypothetical protein [Pseudolysobacter antarcticus]